MTRPRPRRTRQVRDDVAAMVAKRDQLDRDQQQQRQREEAAFDRYARAQLRAAEIEKERDGALAELDRRREQAAADARDQLDAVTTEQCAVLAELNGEGRGRRSADDLASLFDLPVKRVRAMLRRARSVKSASPVAVSAPAVAGVLPGRDGVGATSQAPARSRESGPGGAGSSNGPAAFADVAGAAGG